MEELRQTALAYYRKLSYEEKRLATGMFHAMDANGNGSISYDEYNNFLEEKGAKCIANRSIFKALDRNSDGSLDYEEFLTIHYLFLTKRFIFCDVCRGFLCGAYFSCVQCFFGSSGNTFDLCLDCYNDKSSYNHHNDAVFLDNYAILRYKQREHSSATSSSQCPSVRADCARSRSTARTAVQAVQAVNAVNNLVQNGPSMWEAASSCAQM